MRWRLLRASGYVLLLTVFSAAGFALSVTAVTTVTSQVCEDFAAPSIVSPSDGLETNDDTIMVEGTGEPGMSVVVLRNTTSQAVGTIASDGTFGFTVSLVQGDNTLLAREVNDCGTTKDSAPITIHADLPTPSNPPVTPPATEPPTEENHGETPGQIPGSEDVGKSFKPVPQTGGFQKPKISSANENLTVYVDTLLLEGTAYPKSLLTIYVNGKAQAQLFSSREGKFKVRVVLSEGRNTIKVRSTLGGKTADSNEVTVTYIKRVTAKLTRPLSQGEIITTAVAAGAAVIGSAVAAWVAHSAIHAYARSRIRRK